MKKILFITSLLCSVIAFSQNKLEAPKKSKTNTNFTQNKEAPLYIVNKKIVSEKVFRSINPDDIKSINVYKNDKALELYGEKGRNGVVVILMNSNKKRIKKKIIKK